MIQGYIRKRMEKGNTRMYYFGSSTARADLNSPVRSTRSFHSRYGGVFFRAVNQSIIKQNIQIIEGQCTGDVPLKQLPQGKLLQFKAGDPIRFTGKVKGVVYFYGQPHLEIEIISGSLYFYSCISLSSKKARLLEVLG